MIDSGKIGDMASDGFEHGDWEWSREQLDQVGALISDLVAKHLSGVGDRPVFQPYPADTARLLEAQPLSERGLPVASVLRRFAEQVEPWPFGNGSPRFFGWVNGPPDPIGVFVEALAAAMNPSVAGGNHAATHVERQVIRWVAELLGYPGGGGLLVSGSSAATLHALAAARHQATDGTVRATGLYGRAPNHVPTDRLDDVNRRLLHSLQLSGRAFCSGTEIRGVFALRACIINPRSVSADIEALLTAVLDIGKSHISDYR